MTRAACDPSELSTAELHERCRSCRPWELGLGAVQLVASTAAGGAVLAAAGACIPGLVQCISVGPALAAGLAVWEALGTARAWLPGAAHRDELAFRDWDAGLLPWAEARAARRWAARVMARRPAPDWLLVVEGVAPAGGVRRWARIDLSLPPPSEAPFRARAGAHALLRSGGGRGAAPRARPLAPDEIDELLPALAELPGLSPDSPAPPMDPAVSAGRCDLLIARRTPFAALQLSCPRSALAAERGARAPTLSLLRRVVQMAWPEDENERAAAPERDR